MVNLKTYRVVAILLWLMVLVWPAVADVEPSPAQARLALQRVHNSEYYTGVELLAWSHDGCWLASAAGKDMASRGELFLWKGDDELMAAHDTPPLTALAWSRDDTRLAVGVGGGVRLYQRARWSFGAALSTDDHRPDSNDNPAAMVWLPDGRTVAVLLERGDLLFWNTVSGQNRTVWHGKNGGVTRLEAAPDGRRLVVTDNDSVHVLDTAGRELRVLQHRVAEQASSLAPHSLAFSPDGRLLAVSDGWMIVIWEVATGREIRVLEGMPGGLNGVSNDAQTLSGLNQGDRGRFLWTRRGAQSRRVDLASAVTGSLLVTALSPHGATLVSGGVDGNLVWNDARTGAVRRVAHGLCQWANAVRFSPDGDALAIGYGRRGDGISAGEISLFDARSGGFNGALAAHYSNADGDSGINDIAFSPDGRWLVSTASGADDSDILRLWDARTRRVLRDVPLDETLRASALAFTPDGKTLLCGTHDGYVLVWRDCARVVAGQVKPDLKLDVTSLGATKDRVDRIVATLAIAPGGSVLLASSQSEDSPQHASDVVLSAWSLPEGKNLGALRGGPGVSGVAFARDGATFWSGDDAGVIVERDSKTLGARRQLSAGGAACGRLRLSPDGATLAGAMNGDVWLWDAASGREQRRLYGADAGDWLNDIAWSPDGATLAGAAESGVVRLWNAASGARRADVRRLRVWRDGNLQLRTLSIVQTPGGAFVASPDAGRVIRWRVGDQLLPANAFDAHPEAVAAALQNSSNALASNAR